MSYYNVLGVTPSASPDQIRRAHRELVKKYHPDRLRNASATEIDWAEKRFQEIQEAYEMLSNHRGEYDQQLRTKSESSANPETRASEKTPRPSHIPAAPRTAAPYTTTKQANARSFEGHGRFRLRPVHKVIIVGACFFAVLLAAAMRFVPGQNRGSPGTLFPHYLPSRFGRLGVDRFGGVLRNRTTNVTAQFAIALLWEEGSGSVSGCMAVRDPLSGSGALSGSYSADAFVFTVKSANGKIKFTGKGRDGELSGTYSADLKNGAKESGTFDVDRIHYGEDFINVSYYDCQTDAEVNGEANEDQ